ncbi:MAG: hypothetical protein AB7H66_10355 [Hyphomonadaceae bacterium]
MNDLGRSRRQSGYAASRRRPAFALLALLAVFLQTFVVQTHVHGAPFATGYQHLIATDDEPRIEALGEHQVSCALCQALATSGSATLPSGHAVLAAERATEAAIIALALAPRFHSHSWQSRAPPQTL